MIVDRHTLYELVWAEPMTKVAARYGVSSSFLARVCERLNVPRPARGYWAQLEVGKAPANPLFPEPRPGDELEWSRDGEARVHLASCRSRRRKGRQLRRVDRGCGKPRRTNWLARRASTSKAPRCRTVATCARQRGDWSTRSSPSARSTAHSTKPTYSFLRSRNAGIRSPCRLTSMDATTLGNYDSFFACPGGAMVTVVVWAADRPAGSDTVSVTVYDPHALYSCVGAGPAAGELPSPKSHT